MKRSENVSGMHKDDITREIFFRLQGRTITDGLGHPLRLDTQYTPDEGLQLTVTDYRGNVGTVHIGVGR